MTKYLRRSAAFSGRSILSAGLLETAFYDIEWHDYSGAGRMHGRRSHAKVPCIKTESSRNLQAQRLASVSWL